MFVGRVLLDADSLPLGFLQKSIGKYTIKERRRKA
jgi:hypothetical protein